MPPSMATDATTSRVLLIEDADELAASVGDLLYREGFAVSRATDGPSGLASASRDLPDAIVLDVMLPGLDGFEVCRALRELPATASTIILMMTGLADTTSKLQGLRVGADDYLVKPIVTRELCAKLRRRLDLRAARRLEVQEQRRRAIGEMATAVCHEINNPLTTAVGTLDLLLLGRQLTPDVRRELRTCLDELLRISRTLSGLNSLDDRTVPYLGSSRMIDFRPEPTAPRS